MGGDIVDQSLDERGKGSSRDLSQRRTFAFFGDDIFNEMFESRLRVFRVSVLSVTAALIFFAYFDLVAGRVLELTLNLVVSVGFVILVLISRWLSPVLIFGGATLLAQLALAASVAVGGGEGSSLYWFVALPVTPTFLLGKRAGFLFACSNLALAALVLFSPLPFHEYPYHHATRAFIVLVFVSGLTYMLEFVRTFVEDRLKSNLRSLTRERDRLSEAIGELHVLRGLLPVCPVCAKVRDDDGYWRRIESYLTENSDVMITHGICHECALERYGVAFEGEESVEVEVVERERPKETQTIAHIDFREMIRVRVFWGLMLMAFSVIAFTSIERFFYGDNDNIYTDHILFLVFICASTAHVRIKNHDALYLVTIVAGSAVLLLNLALGGDYGAELFFLMLIPVGSFLFLGAARGLIVVSMTSGIAIVMILAGWTAIEFTLMEGIGAFGALFILSLFSWLIERSRKNLSEKLNERQLVLSEERQSLANTLEEISTIQGLIPICASCRRIRDGQGLWKKAERYLQEHSELEISEARCPSCCEADLTQSTTQKRANH